MPQPVSPLAQVVTVELVSREGSAHVEVSDIEIRQHDLITKSRTDGSRLRVEGTGRV
jgi:hypothetical protein